jgi:hypothetical protein
VGPLTDRLSKEGALLGRHDSRAKKRYDRSVRAAILDWAGIVVDFGSRAPMGCSWPPLEQPGTISSSKIEIALTSATDFFCVENENDGSRHTDLRAL